MKIEVIREEFTDNSTIGTLTIDGKKYCNTIEDKVRDKKIKGVTAIPEGTYNVIQRKVVSPKQEQYKKRFPQWFDYHFELQNVPGYSNVYIHIGNTSNDSEGCILVGLTKGKDFIGNSTAAFEWLYKKMKKEIEDGKTIQLEIRSVK